jgi:class 3 adenylate cyclase
VARWSRLVRQDLLDRVSWSAARGAVSAVRYEPRYLDLLLACGVDQPDVPAPLARLLVSVRGGRAVARAVAVPHELVRRAAAAAERWAGPTGSALVRWFAGASAVALNRASATVVERPLRARAHPGLLVPHTHEVVILVADMRGFSALTRVLDDTQYLANLVGEYLSELTRVVEHHRGVVFQYTGDGLLALFLPELAGVEAPELLAKLVADVSPELHASFDRLHTRWRDEWRASGREATTIGLGLGASFGRATIGFLGPSGKKQFGVIGEPVNVAAYLCSAARAGTMLVDCDSFARAGCGVPPARIVRMRSRKAHQRMNAASFRASV